MTVNRRRVFCSQEFFITALSSSALIYWRYVPPSFTSTIQCPPEIEVKIRSRRAGKSDEFKAFQFVLLRAFLCSKVIRRHYFSLPLRIRCDNTNSCGAVRPHSVGMSGDFRGKILQLKQGKVRVRSSGDVTTVVWNDTRADKYS